VAEIAVELADVDVGHGGAQHDIGPRRSQNQSGTSTEEIERTTSAQKVSDSSAKAPPGELPTPTSCAKMRRRGLVGGMGGVTGRGGVGLA
jgi:hypothetical protein